MSHVVVGGHTRIGAGTRVFPFATIGLEPQDKKYAGEESYLEIGERCVVREHVTINTGTAGGGLTTRVGSRCLLMVGAHVAHDCQVGDDVILANNATLAGHCVVGNRAILGGLSAVHQFVRIGEQAIVGGMSGVENDVIPFGSALGNRAHLGGLNGAEREAIHNLRRAYRALFNGNGTIGARLDEVEKSFAGDANVGKIVAFIRAGGERALCVPRSSRDG
jgi:UDP-N-acetylglucosamine acyltransferase